VHTKGKWNTAKKSRRKVIWEAWSASRDYAWRVIVSRIGCQSPNTGDAA
jgi:hypothetical protein